eukprot:sb/3470818/
MVITFVATKTLRSLQNLTTDYKDSCVSPVVAGFVVIVVVYLALGIGYKRFVLGARGVEQIPNLKFWKDMGEACGNTFKKCRGEDATIVSLKEIPERRIKPIKNSSPQTELYFSKFPLHVVFVVIVVVYLALGIGYKRFVLGARGVEQIPNLKFWKDMGEACGNTFKKCRGEDATIVSVIEIPERRMKPIKNSSPPN